MNEQKTAKLRRTGIKCDEGHYMVEERNETDLRKKLGIPDDAQQVMVFAESSHVDPDWILTSEEYYRLRTSKTFFKAIKELEKDQRRIYSVECIFFLKMFWDRNPDRRDSVRKLVNEGRLRFTGSGVTTPDTIAPDLESIIRDYLVGQLWLKENGMTQEPRLAYLPDDFGHAPTLPTILNALGFELAAFSRIDGCYFPGGDFRRKKDYPRPGSSAELLQNVLKTSEFYWQGPDGSELLCHWNPFTYGQGDVLDLKGPVKWMGLYLGIPTRSEKHVAKRIDRFAQQLSPLAKTPYMFCPIGFDFNDPIPDLLALLDSYNRNVFPSTGVWAVNAGLDDFLDLVSCYRDNLPKLQLDPNPYWTGFYATKPVMKQILNKLSRDLVSAEKLLCMEKGGAGFDPELVKEFQTVWYKIAMTNHHDFITGTSPDRVWKKEQKPWLMESRRLADGIIAKCSSGKSSSHEPAGYPPKWQKQGAKHIVETDLYKIALDENSGACMTSWIDKRTGSELLQGPGNDLVLYYDSGGTWQMGYEFLGGRFRQLCRASEDRARVKVEERKGFLVVSAESELEGRAMLREMFFSAKSPLVKMKLKGSAGKRRTITIHFSTRLQPLGMAMDVPAGVVQRPLQKILTPTFWGAKTFAHLMDSREPFPGLAAFMAGPASVSASSHGGFEWIALRNAPKERAFGFLPVLANPSYAPDPDEHEFSYAVCATPDGNWLANKLHLLADDALASAGAAPHTETLVKTDSEDVKVVAVKPAWLGEGVIVRLQSFDPGLKKVALKFGRAKAVSACLCDAREKDIEKLAVSKNSVAVPLEKSLVSVRVIF